MGQGDAAAAEIVHAFPGEANQYLIPAVFDGAIVRGKAVELTVGPARRQQRPVHQGHAQSAPGIGRCQSQQFGWASRTGIDGPDPAFAVGNIHSPGQADGQAGWLRHVRRQGTTTTAVQA